MQPEFCVILTEPWLTLQTSTTTNDNLLFAPCHPTLNPSPKCHPTAYTTYQMSRQTSPPSNYLPGSLRHQPRLPSHPIPLKRLSAPSQTSTPPSSVPSLMDYCRPSPIVRLTPPSPPKPTKTDSMGMNNTSSITKGPSMSCLRASPSTTDRLLTSTSLLVMGSIKRPSGYTSMMMEPSQCIV
jgi:hypothetical protein